MTQWPALACGFLGGGLMTNAIPHVVNGVSGRAFQTPFASPPGRGLSPPVVNVLWGAANVVAAYLLLVRAAPDLRLAADASAIGAGSLVTAVILAVHLRRFHDRRPNGS